MIITCPNCSTQYDVLPAALGAGKKTRCFNCGYSWFQEPVMASPPPPATHAAIRAMVREQSEYRQAANAQQQMYAQPMPAQATPPAAVPQQMVQPMAQPAAPAPIPEPPAPVMTAPPPMPQPAAIPEPEIELEPEIDEPAPEIEDEPEVEIEAEEDAAGFASPVEDDNAGISKADLDAMFGEDEETEPIASMVGDGGDDDGPMSIDDIDDPDPIPQVYSPSESGDDEPGKKRSVIKMIGIGVGVVLIAVLGGGYFARDIVISMVPAAKGVYEMIGLGEKLGAGLAIQDTKPVPGTQGGKSILTVKGVIANVSDKERPVPMIKVVLKDARENAVQTTIAAPLRNRLPAHKKMRFNITISDPSPLARRIEVEFAKPGAKAPKMEEAPKKH